jgi:glycosyltransferase involved in cell wall biosynthesis
MNQIDLPDWLKSPNNMVSVLVCSYNTKHSYIIECLKSIKEQQGHFGIELVWINDGSNPESSKSVVSILKNFEKKFEKTNCIKIKYFPLPSNQGLSYCLHHGVLLCSYGLIFRMDSDDIMHESRMQKQLEFMNENPRCVLCGTNIISFMKKEGNQMAK